MSKKQKKQQKTKKATSSGGVFFRAVFLILFVITSVVCATMLINQNESKSRIEALSRTLDEQLEQATRENTKALSEKEKMGTMEYLEDYARDMLGMVKAGETIYITEK